LAIVNRTETAGHDAYRRVAAASKKIGVAAENRTKPTVALTQTPTFGAALLFKV
jgi:hypothetical protein